MVRCAAGCPGTSHTTLYPVSNATRGANWNFRLKCPCLFVCAQVQPIWNALPSVAAAMHMKPFTGNALSYTSTRTGPGSDLRPLYKTLAEKYHLLIFSGDSDGEQPFQCYHCQLGLASSKVSLCQCVAHPST